MENRAVTQTNRKENHHEKNSCDCLIKLEDVEGTTREIVFYAYNVDSYLLKITDMHGMLVSAQDVDRLIRILKQKG